MSDRSSNSPPDDDPSAAVAAAMGFSAFGSQDRPPSKKRRFNPHADAVLDPSLAPGHALPAAAPSLPPKPPAPIAGFQNHPVGSGADSRLPLHHRPGATGSGQGASAAGNANEIDLGLSDEDGELNGEHTGGRGEVVPGSGSLASQSNDADGFSSQLPYLPGPTIPPGSDFAASPGGYQPTPFGAPEYSTRGNGRGSGPGWRGGGGRGGHNRGGGNGGKNLGGHFNPDWGKDYFDPKSIENPWGKLEATKGLKPISPWP